MCPGPNPTHHLRAAPRVLPGHRAWCCPSTREEFVCDGLCVFALVIEHPETLIRRHKIRERWLRRAEVAATRFPERMAVVRSRYAKLSGALGSTTFREMPCSAGIDVMQSADVRVLVRSDWPMRFKNAFFAISRQLSIFEIPIPPILRSSA